MTKISFHTAARTLALMIVILSPASAAQDQDKLARFTGSWTGTQRWKVDSPSPYNREGQQVSLTITESGGKISGMLTPFLGSDEGATFTDARISGNHLQATGIIGPPRTADDPSNWKDSVMIGFVFTPAGGNLTGAANVALGNVPWLKLEYRLSRQ